MITSRAEGASALIALHHCRILRVIGAIHHFVITIITSGMGVPPIPSRASCAATRSLPLRRTFCLRLVFMLRRAVILFLRALLLGGGLNLLIR